MVFRILECPSCGAPLPPDAKLRVITCTYCQATVSWERNLVRAADFAAARAALVLPPDPRPRIDVEGRTYAVDGLVSEGEISDVFLARRATSLSERVLVHVLRDPNVESGFTNAWDVLGRLDASTARGAHHFSGLLPQRVHRGELARDGRVLGTAKVLRPRSGFDMDLAELRRRFPDGLDLRHVAWIFRRLMELVDWVHRSGYVHAAIVPAHVLVHARDHGATLVGWSSARPVSSRVPLEFTSAERAPFYPDSVRDGGPVSPATDLVMAARTARWLSGPNEPPTHPMLELLDEIAEGEATGDAMALHARMGAAAAAAFGPPTFVTLRVPPA